MYKDDQQFFRYRSIKCRHLGAEMANETKERHSCSQYIYIFVSRPIWRRKYLNLQTVVLVIFYVVT